MAMLSQAEAELAMLDLLGGGGSRVGLGPGVGSTRRPLQGQAN